MSRAEGFLARWSRRKAAACEAAVPDQDLSLAAPEEATSAAAPGSPPPALPPLDSLGPDSDFTVFLARGVASAVQAAALRVAWTADPAIANFRGMADYDWDFNAPGYGALGAADDAGALLARIVRSGPARLIAGDPVAPQPPAAPCPAPVPVASASPTSGGAGTTALDHAPGSGASAPAKMAVVAAQPRTTSHPREAGASQTTSDVVRASRPAGAATRALGPVGSLRQPDLRPASLPAAEPPPPPRMAADTPPAPALPRRHGGALPA